MSVNQITLIGNIGKEVKMGGNDTNPIANFSIATQHAYKSKTGERVVETDWHRVVAFGQTAKFIGSYAKTGRQAYIQGRVRTRSYTDKDNATRYVTEIVAETFNLLGNKTADDGQRASSTPPIPSQSAAPASCSPHDDDIPF